MNKPNSLANECTAIALKQLRECWTFKLPRIRKIQAYRRLYNTEVLPKLRVQFNVPVPVFSGMIDTMQSDLDDGLVLKYESQDPADWKPIQKLNAAIKQESSSMRPGAQWDEKWRQARQECIFSGRGILKYTADNSGGFSSNLEVVAFEDFFFEPSGGGDLENHMYAGQQNIWKTAHQLKEGADAGIYDKGQVDILLTGGAAKTWKMNGIWDGMNDVGYRFRPLGLTNTSHNYVGEDVFHLVEWVMTYKGKRWYMVIEAYTGTWIRFEKLEDVNSGGYLPWISFASHKDLKNFASKSFCDDLYPVADAIITLFNQDLTNRQKINLNARAYDKDMFKDVAKLDEAQYRPDALVPVDTKGGSRRIQEGIYSFTTPALTGTVDLIGWLEMNTGKHVGVTDMQQGSPSGASKKVGVAFADMQMIGKRINFMSQPFITAGQQLGTLFFQSLKDYMTEPIAVKLLGETGFEWDVLKRLDLSLKRNFEISVVSTSQRNKQSALEKQDKKDALAMVAQSPNINQKARDEYTLRDIGQFTEYETAILLDNTNQANKDSASMLAAAIQEIGLRGKKPLPNYNADLFFMEGLLKFARKTRGSLPTKKFDLLMQYIDETKVILQENVQTGTLPAMNPKGTPGAMPVLTQDQNPLAPKSIPGLRVPSVPKV